MIIQFRVSNFRSIFQTQTLNFRATSLISEKKEVDYSNISTDGQNRILKGLGIYGANASGKSNVIKAIKFFKNMVASSLTDERIASYGASPFRLSSESLGHFGYFEISILLNSKKYRYGFTLTKDANIDAEWLYGPAEKNETFYFTRRRNVFEINPLWFQEADDLPKEKVRGNALFLSFCASYDGTVSTQLRNYFTDRIIVDLYSEPIILGNSLGKNRELTDNLIEKGKKEVVLTWLKEVGIGFTNVSLKKLEISGKLYGNFVTFDKNIYDNKGHVVGSTTTDLDNDESDGTQKFYSYIGTLYKIFEEGGVFVADEIDSKFHPSLLRKLILNFNNSSINRGNAQILFTSHDTNLMNPDIMRRDQFYFTEKSVLEETILFSLSDLKGIRNNADFAKQYLAGLYGALPILGNYLEENNFQQ